MRTALTILCIAMILTSCKEAKTNTEDNSLATDIVEEVAPVAKKVLSPHTAAMAMIGDAHIHIDYASPGVRNRIVFGGLLAYDTVWQAGAHNATWIETNKDVLISGELLPAGKYGFFTIPSKETWTLIFNSNWDQHGKDEYDEKDDVLRFTVTPEISEEITEHLIYTVAEIDETHGAISLSWEKVSLKFNFEINN